MWPPRPGLVASWTAFLFSYVIRFSWSIVMPEVRENLGFTMEQCGYMMSAFYAGYVIMQIPGGRIAERVDCRKLLASYLTLGGVLTVASASMGSLMSGLGWRFLSGVAAGVVYPASIRLIAIEHDPGQRATAMGAFMTAISGGMLVCNALLPALLAHVGWRNTILAIGFGAIACSGALWSVSFRTAHGYAERLDELSPPEPGPGRGPVPQASPGIRVAKQIGVPLLLAGFFGMWCTTGAIPWLFTYLSTGRGLSGAATSAMLTAFSVMSFASGPAAGYLSDRVLRSRRRVIASALVLYALLLLLLMLVARPVGLWAIIVSLGTLVFMADTPRNASLADLALRQGGGGMVGAANMVWQFGLIISSWLVGRLIDLAGGSFGWGLMCLAGAGLAGGAFALRIPERRGLQ